MMTEHTAVTSPRIVRPWSYSPPIMFASRAGGGGAGRSKNSFCLCTSCVGSSGSMCPRTTRGRDPA